MKYEIELQRKAANNLERAIENFGKDGKQRKVKEKYFQDRLDKLEIWWIDYDQRNGKIEKLKENATGDTDTVPYFASNVFEEVKKKYIEFRTVLQESLEKLKSKLKRSDGSSTNGEHSGDIDDDNSGIGVLDIFDSESDSESDEDDADDLNDLDDEQSSVPEVQVMIFQKNEFVQAIRSVKKKKNMSMGLASMQIDHLKVLWGEFRVSYRQIAVSQHKKSCDTIDFSKLQDDFMAVCGKLNDVVTEKMRVAPIKLPEVKLPEFSGNIVEWKTFKDLYEKLVHNNDMVPVALKMQYLKTCLKGKASSLVRHVAPNADNYVTCYMILKNRYENKRENFSRLCDVMLDFPPQTDGSSASLKRFHDAVYESTMAIENMGESTKNWDKLLVQILMKKLDPKTIMDYEQKLNNVKELKSLKYFLSYLEKRFITLSAVDSKTNANKFKSEAKKNEVNNKDDVGIACTYCEKSHSVYRCDGFKSLSPTKRFEWAKEKKACFQCLQFHKPNECKTKYPNCKTCEKKHNTLLHLE